VDGDRLEAKHAAVAEALALHSPHLTATDALEVLRRLGGLELAAIAGAILAARLGRVPVLLDGYVCTAAAAVVAELWRHLGRPGSGLAHCQLAHRSAEPGHRRLARQLRLKPLLELDMRLGEASGAALAIAVVRGAVACHTGMASFEDAGVDGPAASDVSDAPGA